MKNKIDTSRQKTPWDDNEKQTASQKFISEKYKENYRNKHPLLKESNEKELINSIEIIKCRYCKSERIIKKGVTKNGIQRYYCKNCKRYFSPVTNTIFENHKIPITEWIEFLLDLFNYGSLTLTSKVNKNSINTTIYWLQKTFLLLKNYQDSILLQCNVYIDEMFYSVRKRDIETKDGKKLRGLSRNQICIGIGFDGTNILAIVEGVGKTSSQKIKNVFKNHIETGSKLIHDDEKSHNELLKCLKLKDESYNSDFLITLKDEENPLNPINHQCDLIRQFLNAHSGFLREHTQDYLNLYSFMNSGHINKLEKIDELLNLAFNTNVSLKYKDLFRKKDI